MTMQTIKEGIKSLNSDLKKLNRCLKVKVFIYEGRASVNIYYSRFFKNKKIGEISKHAFNMINPKLIDISETDCRSIKEAIRKFQKESL